MIGPNCPGIITPGESLAGITPHTIAGKGPIGLVSKSGTLTYQMMYELQDLGFSTAIGIGGDPIVGTTHIDALEAFEDDPETKAIVMIGEIGGDAEERAAAYIKDHVTKPVVGYVAGFTAPEGKTMGHAGAIVSGSSGTAEAKKEALEAVGVKVGKTPSETAAAHARDPPGPVTRPVPHGPVGLRCSPRVATVGSSSLDVGSPLRASRGPAVGRPSGLSTLGERARSATTGPGPPEESACISSRPPGSVSSGVLAEPCATRMVLATRTTTSASSPSWVGRPSKVCRHHPGLVAEVASWVTSLRVALPAPPVRSE